VREVLGLGGCLKGVFCVLVETGTVVASVEVWGVEALLLCLVGVVKSLEVVEVDRRRELSR